MATNPNGAGPVASDEWTAAKRTQEKHAAHPVMVEDVRDEEDLAHPPPSNGNTSRTETPHAAGPNEEVMLQKVTEEKGRERGDSQPRDLQVKQNPIFDPKSEDAFPALGAGPKPHATTHLAAAWGSKNHAPGGNGQPNGMNGNGSTSNATSSRASTPASSMAPDSMKASGAPQSRGFSIPRMNIPGKHSERIQFSPSQLLPRDQLKKPLADIIRAINKRSKAVVKYHQGPNGTLFFDATGPPDATRQALIDVAKEVGSIVSAVTL